MIARFLLYACMSLFVICGAHAHEIVQGTGVVCDTKEQIARFASLNATSAALKTINDEATHAVCALVEVQYIHGSAVQSIQVPNGRLDLTEIIVVAYRQHQQWIPLTPTLQYTAFFEKEDGA